MLTGLAPPRRPLGTDTYERIACADGPRSYLAVWIVSDEYLDLYVLGVAALVFTILGVTGVAGITVLASLTVALLAFLAFSQIRSRRYVAGVARTQSSDPLTTFRREFPDDLEARRGAASELLLIGVS